MLRRSYDLVPDDDARTSTGMIFCAYQRSLSTFVSTQHRLDREDHLMRFVTVAASGTFLVPPRARRGRPFGSFLLG